MERSRTRANASIHRCTGVQAPFLKRANRTDGGGNGNYFLTATVTIETHNRKATCLFTCTPRQVNTCNVCVIMLKILLRLTEQRISVHSRPVLWLNGYGDRDRLCVLWVRVVHVHAYTALQLTILGQQRTTNHYADAEVKHC